MPKTARQVAIDQADMLVSYLSKTPSDKLDLDFIRLHLETIHEFAQTAHREHDVFSFDDVMDVRIDTIRYILD
jgi:hypothetical protein